MSPNEPPGLQEVEARFKRSVRDHWRLFLGEGIVLVILGGAAIVVPPLAGLAVTIVLGWLLLVGGVVGLASSLSARRAPGFLYSLLSAVVALAAGGLLLWNPLAGVATLTYVLVIFFALDGLLIIFLALEHRRELSGRWEWMMVGGVMDLCLAAIIVLGLPGTLAWALGLLVGIDLLFGGVTLIAMALSAGREAQ